MNEKLVSVIMPCYNDGAYIEEAIDSVKRQTYANWEIIIIDDGSDQEETINVLNSINDERVYVYHTDHLKPAGARNYGIEHAKGKYILPLDSDDCIDSSYLEKAVSVIEKDKSIGAVYCYADFFGERKGRWELPDYSLEKMLIDNIVFVTALFLKEDWEKVGGFNTELVSGMEDYDFWLGILSSGKTIYQIKEVLFHYRIKPVSRTTKFQSDVGKMQETYRQIYRRHKAFYDGLGEEYVIILRDTLIDQVALRMKYERYFEKIQQLYQIPIIKTIVKAIMND